MFKKNSSFLFVLLYFVVSMQNMLLVNFLKISKKLRRFSEAEEHQDSEFLMS